MLGFKHNILQYNQNEELVIYYYKFGNLLDLLKNF